MIKAEHYIGPGKYNKGRTSYYYFTSAEGYTLDRLIERVAGLFGLLLEDVTASGKARQRVEARSLFCYWATTELGIRQTQLTQRLGVHQPPVSNAVRRGA